MALTDPLGDMLTRIRNGQQANKSSINCPASKLRMNVLEVLKKEGYIRGYELQEEANKRNIRIELKYYEGEPVIRALDRVSTPGQIGRAHVCTPVTHAHLVCRLLLAKKKKSTPLGTYRSTNTAQYDTT